MILLSGDINIYMKMDIYMKKMNEHYCICISHKKKEADDDGEERKLLDEAIILYLFCNLNIQI